MKYNRVILICCLCIIKDDLPLYKSWSSADVVVKQSNTNMLPLYDKGRYTLPLYNEEFFAV
jgi:hypothetical protein